MSTLDQIMSIMGQAFDPLWGEAWNRAQVSDALLMPNTFAILISEQGDIIAGESQRAVGFVLSRMAADEEELLLIAVLPQFRGRGLGEHLIDHLRARAERRGVSRIFLEMRHNNPAKRLYEIVGFQQIGKRPGYYRMANGKKLDALTFGLSINSE